MLRVRPAVQSELERGPGRELPANSRFNSYGLGTNDVILGMESLSFRPSPQRPTSAPPMEINQFLPSQRRSYDLSRHLNGNAGIKPTISEERFDADGTPINNLKAPVAKRILRLEFERTQGQHDIFHRNNSKLGFLRSSSAHLVQAQPFNDRRTSFERESSPLTDMGPPDNQLRSSNLRFHQMPELKQVGQLNHPRHQAQQSGYQDHQGSDEIKYRHFYNNRSPNYDSRSLDDSKRRDHYPQHSVYLSVKDEHYQDGYQSHYLTERSQHGRIRGRSEQNMRSLYSERTQNYHGGSRGYQVGTRRRHQSNGHANVRPTRGEAKRRGGGSGHYYQQRSSQPLQRDIRGGSRKIQERPKTKRSGDGSDLVTIGIGSTMHVKWMEEFSTAKTTHVSLEDVAKRDMTVDLAMDQFGSRFIQQKLEKAPASHKEATFNQILPHTLKLCADVFGNYVIQKLFEHGTAEQKKSLVTKIKGNVLTLTMQMYGCRVVQKAIDVLNLDQKAELIEELHGHVMKCVKDQNGNHVIQKCIEKVPPSTIQFVVSAFEEQNMKLATHPYGCRVIQRLLEHCSSAQRNSILKEILEQTQMLAKNQYGNYVIQHVLIHGSAKHRSALMRSFQGNIVRLSKHKFASNVIEKCVTHATRQERQILIEEILGADQNDPNPPLMGMVRDQFANYVVQRLIDVMDPEQRQYLIQRIHRHLPSLRKIPYGKHIVSRIEKIAGYNLQ